MRRDFIRKREKGLLFGTHYCKGKRHMFAQILKRSKRKTAGAKLYEHILNCFDLGFKGRSMQTISEIE